MTLLWTLTANSVKSKDVTYINVTRGETLPNFIMSFLLFSKTGVGLKLCFVYNVRYGNSVTFRIGVAYASLQYFDNHETRRSNFCIECKPNVGTCQLYYYQWKIMIICEDTNI